MFKQDGNFDATIREIVFAESKFAKDEENAFDICIKVEAEIGGIVQSDWWRGEMSSKYGRGNYAGKKQAEITLENLKEIGFKGDDLSSLTGQLVGKKINIGIVSRKHEEKTYYDVRYLNGNHGPTVIDSGSIASRLASFGVSMGQTTTAPTTGTTGAMPGKHDPLNEPLNQSANPLM